MAVLEVRGRPCGLEPLKKNSNKQKAMKKSKKANLFVTTLSLSTALALTASSVLQLSARAFQNPGSRSGETANPVEAIALQSVINVSPGQGTITAALARATSGTVIQLAPGTYGAGETFPLELKPGVVLKGNESQKGQGVVINGGGRHTSRTFARQNVAIVAADNSQIVGVTVTNPNIRGTGIWVEDVRASIKNSTFVNNAREGVFVAGSAAPQIENNQFTNNQGNGVSVAGQASGEIRGNLFEQTGYGVAVGGTAAPTIANNQIRNNRSGVVATQEASPMLQGNQIQNNRDYGVVSMNEARPNIASSNSFGGNGRQDTLLVGGASQTASAPSPAPTISGSSGATFSCVLMDSNYATVAQRGSATMPQPMIMWTRTVGSITPVQRCQTVTQRLNNIVADNGGSMNNLVFMVGNLNRQKVVCLTDDAAAGCNNANQLFTLSAENASNAQEVLKSLITFTVVGSAAPVFESSDDEDEGSVQVPLSDLDAKLQPDEGLWFAQ